MDRMQRTLFEPEHDMFRDMVRTFMERSVAARHAYWEKAGIVDRDVWLEAGKQGMLGMDVPEEYGGGGVADFRYNVVLDEEIIRIGATGLGFGLHNDIVGPYTGPIHRFVVAGFQLPLTHTRRAATRRSTCRRSSGTSAKRRRCRSVITGRS